MIFFTTCTNISIFIVQYCTFLSTVDFHDSVSRLSSKSDMLSDIECEIVYMFRI